MLVHDLTALLPNCIISQNLYVVFTIMYHGCSFQMLCRNPQILSAFLKRSLFRGIYKKHTKKLGNVRKPLKISFEISWQELLTKILEIEKPSLNIIRKLSVWKKGKLQAEKNIYSMKGKWLMLFIILKPQEISKTKTMSPLKLAKERQCLH